MPTTSSVAPPRSPCRRPPGLGATALAALLTGACDTPPASPAAPVPATAAASAPGTLAAPHVLLREPGVENAYPRLSRDGRRVLYQSNRTGSWQLFVIDVASGTQQRLTHGAADANFPDWSPDEQWVAFVSTRDGDEELYAMRIDGSGVERLTDDPGRDIHPHFTPDGRALLFNSTRGNGSLDVYRLELGDRSVRRLTSSRMHETCARYAPDGRTWVMLQNGALQDDLLLVDAATGRETNLTHTPLVRDGWPAFSPDGAWILYSTMASGRHCLHRLRADGSGDERLTDGGDGIEDGRAVVSADGTTLAWNRRYPDRIDILLAKAPS